ncbi:hypothetical protein PIB30_001569 [Stylosanthes scabra]|uniref:Uncharacterized protein n=1 Tax=Stylosanthes scabra TaxID=79078 RepID=A0ABU6R2L8_9FABA|nr:hypothetical protein [Stylosanthes scabra]
MAAEENTAGNNSRQWALLGDDILNIITHRFDDIYDYARFGAVCKPWLSFSHRFYNQKKHLFRANHQLPLLVVPMEGHQQIRDNKSAEIELLLINPFASKSEKSLIRLPPFLCHRTVPKMDEFGVSKAVLSKDPNEFSNDFEVIVT